MTQTVCARSYGVKIVIRIEIWIFRVIGTWLYGTSLILFFKKYITDADTHTYMNILLINIHMHTLSSTFERLDRFDFKMLVIKNTSLSMEMLTTTEKIITHKYITYTHGKSET
jgi:hypothetical protein